MESNIGDLLNTTSKLPDVEQVVYHLPERRTYCTTLKKTLMQAAACPSYKAFHIGTSFDRKSPIHLKGVRVRKHLAGAS